MSNKKDLNIKAGSLALSTLIILPFLLTGFASAKRAARMDSRFASDGEDGTQSKLSKIGSTSKSSRDIKYQRLKGKGREGYSPSLIC